MFHLPWTEKYRPTTLSNFTQTESIYKKFQAFESQKHLPNLILSGPPGSGKTTITHCLARSILGEAYKSLVFELNASESRGINIVRQNIKTFASKDITAAASKIKNFNNSPVKIIILDEVDNMTEGAQQALRRTMENFNNDTRFILTCNISSKIIEPIQSRCSIIRFEGLTEEKVIEKLKDIASSECLKYEKDVLESIANSTNGDLRKAIGYLQACSLATDKGEEIKLEILEHIVEKPLKNEINSLFNLILENDIYKSIKMMRWLNIEKGYTAKDIVGQLIKCAEYFGDITLEKRGEILRVMAECLIDITEKGNNTHVRLIGCLCDLNLIKV